MTGEIHNVSHQLGELVGIVKSLDEKFDSERESAREHRDLLHAELRNVKHDQRGMEQKVESIGHRMFKFEPYPLKFDALEVRVVDIEAWRNQIVGARVVMTAIGVVIGFFISNFTMPMLSRLAKFLH